MGLKNYKNKLNKQNKLKLNRSRSEIRHNYFRCKNRKLNLLYDINGKSSIDKYYTKRHKGQLSKGKIHCSCNMCSTKSKDSLKISDLKKINKLDFDLNESKMDFHNYWVEEIIDIFDTYNNEEYKKEYK